MEFDITSQIAVETDRPKPNLLKWGKFKSHSGLELNFKIDCDALTDDDIECCANIIASELNFSHVVGIPRGGVRLAAALRKHCTEGLNTLLIVDDVLTTGNSFKEAFKANEGKFDTIVCAVIFDRGELDLGIPVAVYPIFML